MAVSTQNSIKTLVLSVFVKTLREKGSLLRSLMT